MNLNFLFIKFPATHKYVDFANIFASTRDKLTQKCSPADRQKFVYLPTHSFKQATGGISPLRFHSTYSFTAAINFFENREYADYSPTANAYVKESGKLDSSKEDLRKEPQILRPKA